jgi:hypothetical protein
VVNEMLVARRHCPSLVVNVPLKLLHSSRYEQGESRIDKLDKRLTDFRPRLHLAVEGKDILSQ